MRFFNSIVMLGVLMMPKLGLAQEGKTEIPGFNSDRPGFSYSAQVLPKGALTLQSGFLYNFPTEYDLGLTSYKTSSFLSDHLIRYGLLNRIELGAGFAYNTTRTERLLRVTHASAENSTVKTLTAPTFIVRGQVLEEHDKVPAVNLQYQVDVARNINADEAMFRNSDRTTTQHTARLSIAKSYNNLGLATNINVPLDGGRDLNYTINVSYSFFNGGIFGEVFGPFENGLNEDGESIPVVSWNTGMWYRLSKTVRLDLGGGHFAGFDGNFFAAVGATFNLRN